MKLPKKALLILKKSYSPHIFEPKYVKNKIVPVDNFFLVMFFKFSSLFKSEICLTTCFLYITEFENVLAQLIWPHFNGHFICNNWSCCPIWFKNALFYLNSN